jgi:hypothetical protein
MKNIREVLTIILLTASLAACHGLNSKIEPDPTEVFEAAISIAGTEIAKTQKAVPSTTPTYSPTFWATASLRPGENIIATPKPEQQVYTDPEGWYSVFFPADFEPTDKETRFAKGSSYFETGYLPEMGYVTRTNNVCAWLANIVEEEPENFIVNGSFSSASCSILTKPDVSRQIKYEIYENPGADPAHRFVFVKTSWYGSPIKATFSWLKPINQAKYISKLAPLDAEEIAEWESIAPLLQNVSITEYDLTPGSSPYCEMLISSLPEEAKPDWARKTNSSDNNNDEEEPSIEETLQSLGYELTGGPGQQQLYREGRLLFDPVWKTGVYEFNTDSGPISAIVVVSQYGQEEAFLIQNDIIHQWHYSHQDPHLPPVLFQDELLWLRASDDWNHVQVIKSNQEIFYSFSIHTEPMLSTRNFINWDGHWVWVLLDFLIVDGEILNEKLGFQEIFYWKLIDDKPAYLLHKDGRAGFSYDGKILPLEYQNIARYMCCGYAVNNPYIGDHSAHFFAERDGVWYYVVIKFR